VSATLTHLATGPKEHAAIPTTSVPNGLTRKRPLIIRSGPLPLHPLLKRLTSIQRTDPNPIYSLCPSSRTPNAEDYMTFGLILQPPAEKRHKPFPRANRWRRPAPPPARRYTIVPISKASHHPRRERAPAGQGHARVHVRALPDAQPAGRRSITPRARHPRRGSDNLANRDRHARAACERYDAAIACS
jgi:hypothetical protein